MMLRELTPNRERTLEVRVFQRTGVGPRES